jgi:hypothetical protein
LPDSSFLEIEVDVEMPTTGVAPTTSRKLVRVDYAMTKRTLASNCNPSVGSFFLTVEATAVETSDEVMKNFYEHRTAVTTVRFNNAAIEWDSNYRRSISECEAAVEAVKRKHIPTWTPPGPEPEPFEFPAVEEVIRTLIERNPSAANVVIDEIGKMSNINKVEILKKL